MTTTFLPASLDRLVSRALVVSAVSAASLLAACGGGSDAGTAAASSATAPASAAAAGATTTTTTATAATAGVATPAVTSQATASDAVQQDAIRTASALAGTAGTATLSWKAVTGAVSYRVYYGTASRTYLQPLGSGTPAATAAITLSGLTSGQTYWFSVTGVDASGLETAYSDETTALVP